MAKRGGRVRQHVIADIAQQHVQSAVTAAGFTPMAVAQGTDYGIDLPVATFDAEGLPENGHIVFQIKAAERLRVSADNHVSVRLPRALLRRWQREPFPVIVVWYDVAAGRGYWLYVQRRLTQIDDRRLRGDGDVTLRIPCTQVLTPTAMLEFAAMKRRLLDQMNGVIDHG